MDEKQKEALLAKMDSKGITLVLVDLKERAYEEILRTTTLSTAKVILVAEDTAVLDDKARSALTNKVSITSSEEGFNVSYYITTNNIPELFGNEESTTRLLIKNGLINTEGGNHMYVFVNEHDDKTLNYLNGLLL